MSVDSVTTGRVSLTDFARRATICPARCAFFGRRSSRFKDSGSTAAMTGISARAAMPPTMSNQDSTVGWNYKRCHVPNYGLPEWKPAEYEGQKERAAL